MGRYGGASRGCRYHRFGDEKKIVQRKRNESGKHHFQAASRLKALLLNSRLAVVEEPVGQPNVPEVHKRYAWAEFPDGSTRHVMMMVFRWKRTPLDSDTAYSLEAIETSLNTTPSENRDNYSPSDGAETAHDGGNGMLRRFVAGSSPNIGGPGPDAGSFPLGAYRSRLRSVLGRADAPPEYRRRAVEVARRRLAGIGRRHRARVAATCCCARRSRCWG